MSYLNELNPKQQEAVLHTDGPLLVFAGAGSGKTRVLTYRVAHLIENGVEPYNIIAITFTNKAAKEMRERITNISPLGERVWVSTFHSACVRILRYEVNSTGYKSGFSIYDSSDTNRIIKNITKELKLDVKDFPVNFLQNRISQLKNDLITPEIYEKGSIGHFRNTKIADVYSIYQKRLEQSNAFDFDDLILKTVELLKTNVSIREKYQERFKYVLVDEYQDTNNAQYEFVNLISGKYKNLCVVGDDDQSIYGWRGANIENILRFDHDHPKAKVVKLEQNYRSTKTVLSAANAVIGQNEERAKKSLWTENETGTKIGFFEAYNEREEGIFVVNTIKSGIRYSDFAVLYRNNSQSRAIEDQLVMAGIPYRIFGGLRFYERMEIKDVLAYLKAIANPFDDLQYMRIINVPRRGIGDATIDKLIAYAVAKGVSLFEAMVEVDQVPGIGKKTKPVRDFCEFMSNCMDFSHENTVSALMDKILEETKYIESLMDGTPEAEGRIENIEEFLSKIREFEQEADDTSLDSFLEEVSLVADIDNYQEGVDAVSLMTVHSAKGLEFDNVFIVGFEENIFPSYRSLDPANRSLLEEERRICYVGFTRARKHLFLSRAKMRSRFGERPQSSKTSRFYKEIPEDFIRTMNLTGQSKQVIKSIATKPKIELPTPKKTTDLKIGDKVKHIKHGIGIITAISPAGADYELTIDFTKSGTHKLMANLHRISRWED